MSKRLIVCALSLVLLAGSVSALDFEQKAFYGQGVLALPIGDWSDFAKIGFGAGVGMTVPHTEILNFRGEISYIFYSTEDIEGGDYSFSMIPVNILGEYHMESMYLLGGLGLVFAKSKVETEAQDFGGGFTVPAQEVSSSDSEIGLVLGAGFELSPSMVLEGRFNLVSDANFLSANLGFRF
jgi:opacity protein-like surface antigen